MDQTPKITPAQRSLGDMEVEEFRGNAHRVADQVADYLGRLEDYAVLPDLEPGSIRAQLPAEPPARPEPIDDVLQDYSRLIEPNITHWQHPGFMAYFPSVASGPGILGEWLASSLNSNVMFWRNAPSSTELEEVVVSWLRQMLGLPDGFDGMFTDTASVSSMLSLVAARHAVPGLNSGAEGLAGRAGLKRLRMYISEEAHMSIEKAAIVTGIGRAGVRRVPTDEAYRMIPEQLQQAIREDRDQGWAPFCVVGTLGTTSSTSVDPAAALAEICRREGLWLHFDAAYAGSAAVMREMRHHFAGWEEADSIVVNPHKWLFTPFDASLLLFRDAEKYRDAFSIVPEYLRTPVTEPVRNFNEYGIQLGRRFRALKLWIQIRYFGVEGIAERLREHCRMAGELASWVDADPDWERLAPTPFATVCFRFRPETPAEAADVDRVNQAILDEVNRSGKIFLSHTRLNDRFTIRVSIGNPRQTMDHVRACWTLLKSAAERVSKP
jgi:aromatic-L-amino-acid decarboxylase